MAVAGSYPGPSETLQLQVNRLRDLNPTLRIDHLARPEDGIADFVSQFNAAPRRSYDAVLLLLPQFAAGPEELRRLSSWFDLVAGRSNLTIVVPSAVASSDADLAATVDDHALRMLCASHGIDCLTLPNVDEGEWARPVNSVAAGYEAVADGPRADRQFDLSTLLLQQTRLPQLIFG